MSKYNYDELMEKALNKEELTEKEWKFLIHEGKQVDEICDEPRRWLRWVDVILEWQGKYVMIGYDQGLTECQENEYYASCARLVKKKTKMVEVTEWVEI